MDNYILILDSYSKDLIDMAECSMRCHALKDSGIYPDDEVFIFMLEHDIFCVFNMMLFSLTPIISEKSIISSMYENTDVFKYLIHRLYKDIETCNHSDNIYPQDWVFVKYSQLLESNNVQQSIYDIIYEIYSNIVWTNSYELIKYTLDNLGHGNIFKTVCENTKNHHLLDDF